MGSDSKSNGGDAGSAAGNVQIPPAVKKVLQDIREILSDQYTDSEIYAVLRDCDMDPNDAVQRLLSEGPRKDSYTFHEVKSKRERRREMKETQEFKVRANNSTLNRGTRVGSEHTLGQTASTHIGLNELGKASLRRENGSVASFQSSASSTYRATGKILNEKSSPQSDSLSSHNRSGRQPTGTGDTDLSSVQISPGFQPTWEWGSNSGHVSMADIVRMGRPSNKDSQTSFERSYTLQDIDAPNSIHYDVKPSPTSLPSQTEIPQDLQSLNLEMRNESGMTSGQYDYDSEWLVNDQMTASSGPPVSEKTASTGAQMFSSKSYLHGDRNLVRQDQSDDVQLSGRDTVDRKNHNSDYTWSAEKFSGQMVLNGAGGTYKNGNDFANDVNSVDSSGHAYKWQDGRDSDTSLPNQLTLQSDEVNKTGMTTATNLQQLSLAKEPTVPLTEDIRGLVLPNYLQAFAADCSHLSFGTYNSGKNSASSGPQTSSSLATEVEKSSAETDSPSPVHLDSRNSVNYGDKVLGHTHGTHKATVDTRNHISSSQAELLNHDFADTAYGQEYLYSVIPDSTFGNIQQNSSTLSSLINANAKNLTSFPSELQAHSNSVADDFLALKARGSATYHATQSMPSRYGSALSPTNPSIISMYEGLNSGAFPRTQSSSQSLPGDNLAIRPEHSYSQIGYVVPESYGLLSTFPQSHLDSGALYRPPPGLNYNLHHRSGGTPMSSLPLSGSNLSGYGNFENSNNNPLSFVRNLSMASTGSKVGYDELLPAQFKEGNNFPLYQQNDSPATWDYGSGSRTAETAIPESAYYNFPERYQHHAGYGQGQLSSQNQGGFLHPSVYNSHTSITPEQKQQSPSDFILSSSRPYSSRELPQIWKPSY
ncbi:hypothetical protein SLA2020_013960 [Shorea laevis]